jgi:hypothetical protein
MWNGLLSTLDHLSFSSPNLLFFAAQPVWLLYLAKNKYLKENDIIIHGSVRSRAKSMNKV